MNKIILILSLAFSGLLHAGGLIEEAYKSLLPGGDKKFFATIYERERELVSQRTKEREEFLTMDKQVTAEITTRIDALKKAIASYEQTLQQDPDNELIKKKLEAHIELFQLLNDKKQVREQIKTLIDEQIKISQEYLADPDQHKFATHLNSHKSTFAFDEDLLKKHEMIMEQEKIVTALMEQETNTLAELENRKRAAVPAVGSSQRIGNESKDIQSSRIAGSRDQKELAQLQEEISAERTTVNDLRMQEIGYKLNILRTKLLIARRQLELLNEAFCTIKQATQVSQSDVAIALDELDKKRQQSFGVKDKYRQDIERITVELSAKERELNVMSKRYNVPIDHDVEEWTKTLRARAASYVSYVRVASLYEEVQVLKRNKELLEAHIAIEEERLRSEGLRIGVKESFYRMAGRKFATEEEVTKEIKKYDTPRAEAKANVALYKERQNAINVLLATKKKALDNIKERLHNAEDIRKTVFDGQQQDYDAYTTALKEAENRVQAEIDILTKLGFLYADLIALISNTIKHIDFINAELASITIWYRPAHAISLQGIKNSIPELQTFFKNIVSYISTLRFDTIGARIYAILTSGYDWLLLIVEILIAVGFLFALRRYLPFITNKLLSLENAPSGIRLVGIIAAIMLGFGIKHILSLIIWIMLFLSLLFHGIPDPYPYILFYLCSIPYLVYLANRLMRYVMYFNIKYDYPLLSKDYQQRFIVVFSALMYATIIIFFLRESFIIGNYHKSELPTILLAINFIIFQISAILLLSKDQILSLIPRHTRFWEWMHELVDSYYYLLQLFLIAVIVMSNPYVGYGRLVLYLLKRLLFTAILLQIVFWLHEWLKRASSRIFFYSDNEDEIVRDRFSYAKTWYGIVVIAILLAFTFLGSIVAARIWGWPEVLLNIHTWHDVLAWVKTPLLLENTRSPISLYTLLRILGFVITGSFIAFVINRYVLGRIFDILLIEAGVQYTISSLVRYLVIIAAFIVGFQAVGLGDIVIYLITGLVLGIGWVIKDPMADLVAYFVIILQRPIKVGDFISLDNQQVTGVVRRITPRSVEVRHKNSSTIVIPNTHITTRSIVNWNFVRGFVAFDDILITVPYRHDPAKVRELLLRVLDESRFILKNPRPIVRLEMFNELGYVFMVRGFLSSAHTLDMWDIASDIRFAIIKRLKEHGIEPASGVRMMMPGSDREPHPSRLE